MPESLLKQYIPASLRNALTSCLEECKYLSLTLENITQQTEMIQMQLVVDNTTQEPNNILIVETSTIGDLSQDSNQA